MFKRGVYFGSEVDSGSVAYRCLKGGGIFWEGGVDYGSVAYSSSEEGILWRDGRLWEGRVSKGRGYILGGRSRF